MCEDLYQNRPFTAIPCRVMPRFHAIHSAILALDAAGAGVAGGVRRRSLTVGRELTGDQEPLLDGRVVRELEQDDLPHLADARQGRAPEQIHGSHAPAGEKHVDPVVVEQALDQTDRARHRRSSRLSESLPHARMLGPTSVVLQAGRSSVAGAHTARHPRVQLL